MSKCGEKDWFVDWFNSPYYSLLYQNRDHTEARQLVSSLVHYFKLPLNSSVLDLACGKGRHSIELHSEGMVVTGLDLSSASIAEAKKFESPGLHFVEQDMRRIELSEKFDLVLNLFTSFGYFEKTSDNLLVLSGSHGVLREGGHLVIDYLNCQKALESTLGDYQLEVNSCSFLIKKEKSGQFIRKSIEVHDGNQTYHFEEKVQVFSLSDFRNMLEQSGFGIIDTFGGYELQQFNLEDSDRLIIVAERI
jgi:SAM-dependent methyltransferase